MKQLRNLVDALLIKLPRDGWSSKDIKYGENHFVLFKMLERILGNKLTKAKLKNIYLPK